MCGIAYGHDTVHALLWVAHASWLTQYFCKK